MDVLHDIRDDTTGHGTVVTALLLAASYNIEFNFYRVTQRVNGGYIRQRDLQNALGKAHLDDDVDVINLSIGNDHTSDGNVDCISGQQPCKIHQAAQNAVEDGITTVAAAGNRQQFNSLSCPSYADGVISVAGFVAKCKARLSPDNPLSLAGEYIKPPNACWIERTDTLGSDEVFCSGHGCSPIHTCDDYREIVPWEGNVQGNGDKPDILAPTGIPLIWGVPRISVGTSWSVPFVTATVAEIMASLRDIGVEVTPGQLQQAVIEGANEFDDGAGKLFNSVETWYHVYDELGVPRPDFNFGPEFDLGA